MLNRIFHFGQSILSLRFRLFLLILVAVIPGIFASLYVGYEYREHEISRIKEDTLSIVRHAAQEQEELISRNSPTFLRLLASLYPEVRAQDGPKMSALFSRLLAEYPQYINIMAADATTGEVFASGIPLKISLNLKERPYFSAVIKTRNYIVGEFALGKATGKPTLTCAFPVFSKEGAVISIIAAGINIERLAQQAGSSQPNKNIVITLLDRNGTIIFNSRRHESWVGKSISEAKLWEFLKNKDEGIFFGKSYDQLESFVAFKPLIGAKGKGDGYVIAGIDKNSAIESANRLTAQTLIGLVIGTVLALIGGLLFGHRSILRNVNSLLKTAECIADGDLRTRSNFTGKTEEFKRIANALDMMSDKLLQREVEQKTAERALFDEKERLMVTLKSIGDGVITTDSSGNIVLLNQMAEKLTGWSNEEATGRPLTEVFHIINERTRLRCINPVEKVLETGTIVELANHTALISKDGRELIIADSGAPIRDHENDIIGVVLVFRDITEKQQMEDELIRAEKLESLGVLAGGIAHDFNNLLTAILGNITIASLKCSHDDSAASSLKKAEKAALRARDLTGRLLSFTSACGVMRKKTITIKELIEETSQFVLSGANIGCEFDIPNDLWPVSVDEGQFTQVINNLILNSVQAMPGGGAIIISGENCVVGPDSILALKPQNYVKLAFKDQGQGIPEEHLEKIFDPYFTTKSDGIGLGLASSYYIVKRHDGLMTVDSTPGAGATFYIYLPFSNESLHKKEAECHELIGSGRILLMDDEELVRDVAEAMLTGFGFEVDPAENGHEAVAKYRFALESGQAYTASIVDLTVPGSMGGREASGLILEIDPSAKIFASSGYSNDAVMSNYKEYGFCGVIPKPYLMDEMKKALCEVLYSENNQ